MYHIIHSSNRRKVPCEDRCLMVYVELGSYWQDLEFEAELQIQVTELLLDDTQLSQVVVDVKSSFTQIEVLDSIFPESFFSTKSWGRLPTTSQYFQPLALQTFDLAAAVDHCVLSEYASGKKPTVTFSPDEYQGTFCPSPVKDFTLEATACINHPVVGCIIPPTPLRRKSTRIGAAQTQSVLLSRDWCSSIPFRRQFRHCLSAFTAIGTP